jgi:MurNAc alpha-1-phosphate uridylyltransferase
LFANLKEGIKIKLSEILESAINKKSIQGELFEGAWSDIGTPDRLDHINSSN